MASGGARRTAGPASPIAPLAWLTAAWLTAAWLTAAWLTAARLGVALGGCRRAPASPGAAGPRLLADRQGAVAVEFALVTGLLLVPFLLLVADTVLRISGERRLQDAMHMVSMTVASDPAQLDQPAALLALAADIVGVPPAALELETTAVCYCPDAEGLGAGPVSCQSPCHARLTFRSLALVHAQAALLPFDLPIGEPGQRVARAEALVLTP
jgi:hypothetical protein